MPSTRKLHFDIKEFVASKWGIYFDFKQELIYFQRKTIEVKMLNSPTQNNCFLNYPHVFFISIFCDNFFFQFKCVNNPIYRKKTLSKWIRSGYTMPTVKYLDQVKKHLVFEVWLIIWTNWLVVYLTWSLWLSLHDSGL